MKQKKNFSPVLLRIVAAAAILLSFGLWLTGLNRRQQEAGRLQLETALRRSAAACYAAQGFYPPDLEYLKAHYGLQIDEGRYRVFYEIFAHNLMPEITVLERVP